MAGGRTEMHCFHSIVWLAHLHCCVLIVLLSCIEHEWFIMTTLINNPLSCEVHACNTVFACRKQYPYYCEIYSPTILRDSKIRYWYCLFKKGELMSVMMSMVAGQHMINTKSESNRSWESSIYIFWVFNYISSSFMLIYSSNCGWKVEL